MAAVALSRSTTASPDVVIDAAGLAALAPEWNALVAGQAWSSVFATHAFVTHWFDCFAPDAVRVYRVRAGRETIGFLPLVLERRRGMRVLRSLSNLHCMHSTPPIRRGDEGRFALAATSTLAAARGWDILEYDYAYSFHPSLRVIDAPAAAHLGLRVREHEDDTFSVAFRSSFAEYLSTQLSPNAKKNYRRLANRLDKAGANRLLAFRGREAVAEWPALVRIEDTGWKGKAGSSLARLDDAYRRYYAGWLDLLADRDELRLYFLELNGERIAGVFGYLEGDVFHWFKTGYDEARADLAPSNILILRIIEHLMTHEPRVRRFHLFPVDFGYKHRYANEPALYVRTTVYNATLPGRIAYARVAARERLKRVEWLRNAVRAIRR